MQCADRIEASAGRDDGRAFEVMWVPDAVDAQGFAVEDEEADAADLQERVQAYREWKDSLADELLERYADGETCGDGCEDCSCDDGNNEDASADSSGYMYLGDGSDALTKRDADIDEIDNRAIPDFEAADQHARTVFCHERQCDETSEDELFFEEDSVYEDDV